MPAATDLAKSATRTVSVSALEMIRSADPTRSAPDHSAEARNSLVPTRRPLPRRVLSVFLNPYAQLAIGSLLVTASELLMKKGATDPAAGSVGWLGIAALGSWWTWTGIATYVLSFFSWIYVLRFVPLGIAYALINITHVLIPLGAWIFLHEAVSMRRWAGISLVLCGLLLILRSAVNAEEKL